MINARRAGSGRIGSNPSGRTQGRTLVWSRARKMRENERDAWYDSNRVEPGYGSYASPGGESGPGGGGWDPDPPRRGRRRRHLLVYLTLAAVAAGIGAGLTVAFGGQAPSPSASSANGIP